MKDSNRHRVPRSCRSEAPAYDTDRYGEVDMESTSSNDKPGSSSIISSAKTLQGLARPVRFEQGTKLAKFTECSGVHEHGLDLPLAGAVTSTISYLCV